MIFAYDVQHWIAFLGAALLLNLAPGPDMGFLLANTMRGGRTAGFAAMLGIWTGALGHVLLAVAGLSALVAASALAFSIIKYAGAVYLIWLGVQALRSKGAFHYDPLPEKKRGLRTIFMQGVVIDLFNPKVAMFFLAFLSQFVEPQAGAVSSQLLLHGLLIIAVAAFVEPPLILLADRVTKGLRNNQTVCRWLDRGLGALLVFLGLRLAATQR